MQRKNNALIIRPLCLQSCLFRQQIDIQQRLLYPENLAHPKPHKSSKFCIAINGLPCSSVLLQDKDSSSSPWVFLNITDPCTAVGLASHHIYRCYICQAGWHTVCLLLISGPEIGSLGFPWLLLQRWQPFFHGLSARGMLPPVFLVAVWNWRNSKRGHLSGGGGLNVCVFLCVDVMYVAVQTHTAVKMGH